MRRQYTNQFKFEHSRIDKCQQGMLRFDLYKQPFRLLLPDGKNEYRTFTGAVLSLCTILIVIFYGGIKTRALVGREDFKIQKYVEESYYDSMEKFTYEDGFAVAASLTGEDNEYRPKQEDPKFGALNFYHKMYSATEELKFVPISSRPCKREDFNFGKSDPNEDGLFYPTINSLEDLEYLYETMICVEKPEEIYIYGNYDTS